MLVLSKPSVSDLLAKIEFAIERHKSKSVMNAHEQHEKIKQMYNWRDVARRTQVVYDLVDSYNIEHSLVEKLTRYHKRIISIQFYNS